MFIMKSELFSSSPGSLLAVRPVFFPWLPVSLKDSQHVFIFSLFLRLPAPCDAAATATRHSAALPESAEPPESWTQRARFRLYLRFLSVALDVINQLLKPSSSLALMRSFSSWSPVSLVVPFRFGVEIFLFHLFLSSFSFLFSLFPSFQGHVFHFLGFHLSPWLMTCPVSLPVRSEGPAPVLHLDHLSSLEVSQGPWAQPGQNRTLPLLPAGLGPS